MKKLFNREILKTIIMYDLKDFNIFYKIPYRMFLISRRHWDKKESLCKLRSLRKHVAKKICSFFLLRIILCECKMKNRIDKNGVREKKERKRRKMKMKKKKRKMKNKITSPISGRILFFLAVHLSFVTYFSCLNVFRNSSSCSRVKFACIQQDT